MRSVVTSSEMRRLDRNVITKYGLPVVILMEHAGHAVAEAARDLLRPKRSGKVIILCGGGNNGGDGVAAARWLKGWGFRPQVLWLKDPAAWTNAPRTHYEIARRFGVRFAPFAANRHRALLQKVDLLIDGLLGTGTRGEVRDDYRRAIEAINASRRPIVAVDIPSGLDADTGKSLGVVVRATCTITMAVSKKGLLARAAKRYVGHLRVADIGFPATR